ncbi:MAG TPA: glycosyltransferase family 87 protein [Phycisphaerae bacterium]|nr:glycosyltransferase family 87 protein [Phycisphaerae bacterium]
MGEGRVSLAKMLPYSSPLPADPRRRGPARLLRVAGYVVVIGAILTGIIQYQYRVVRNLRRAEAFDANYGHLSPQEQAAQGLKRPKDRAGAIARWRRATHDFWAGKDIYRRPPGFDDPNVPWPDPNDPQRPWLHPNMPFTVILLTPLAHLSKPTMGVVLNALKLLVLAASVLMAARVVNHRDRRMGDWVVLLAMLYVLLPVIGDIRHGNTNTFVLGAVVLHLWLFRRGRDVAAGAALALAICLKMTPALFVLYWLYQRNWRLLAGTVAALVLFVVVVPAAAVGPTHYAALMDSWLNNLIFRGLKGAWYPIHINQSLQAVAGRYFLDGPGGNIFWNPDDNPYWKQDKFQWITLAALSPQTVRWIIRGCQVAIVGLVAWAIGWRRLRRDDGRRALHYGLIAAAILILNQRTWDHHGVVLMIAHLAAWYAIAYGRLGRRARLAALVLMVVAGPLLVVPGAAGAAARLAGGSSAAAEAWVNVAEAYGPRFGHFAAVLAALLVACLALRRADDPYASERQRL